MAVDKVGPNDPRIKKNSVDVKGHKWYYLEAVPEGTPRGTVVLIHGWPDNALGWRYTIPMLMGLGLRCIAFDCMGYGDTGMSDNLRDFGFKSHADAAAAVAKQVGAKSIILGGHDWGGAAVYRMAQWLPDLVSHVFSVATPYFKVSDEYHPVEETVKVVPQFGYQLQLGSEDHKVEKAVNTPEKLRKFLTAMYGGRPSSNRIIMDIRTGIDFSVLDDEIAMTPLFNQEELEYYIAEYSKNGLEGPCNWYRTAKINWEDDQGLPEEVKKTIKQPTLYVQALKDNILTPALAADMEQNLPNLTRAELNTGHWALWEAPAEANRVIKEWFEAVVFGGKSKI